MATQYNLYQMLATICQVRFSIEAQIQHLHFDRRSVLRFYLSGKLSSRDMHALWNCSLLVNIYSFTERAIFVFILMKHQPNAVIISETNLQIFTLWGRVMRENGDICLIHQACRSCSWDKTHLFITIITCLRKLSRPVNSARLKFGHSLSIRN